MPDRRSLDKLESSDLGKFEQPGLQLRLEALYLFLHSDNRRSLEEGADLERLLACSSKAHCGGQGWHCAHGEHHPHTL